MGTPPSRLPKRSRPAQPRAQRQRSGDALTTACWRCRAPAVPTNPGRRPRLTRTPTESWRSSKADAPTTLERARSRPPATAMLPSMPPSAPTGDYAAHLRNGNLEMTRGAGPSGARLDPTAVVSAFDDGIAELRRWAWPADEYVVFGSGPLHVHGIREASDVGVVVTQARWDRSSTPATSQPPTGLACCSCISGPSSS